MGILKIGLTGGIAAGKSRIAKMFKALGTELIDADLIARQVTEIGTPAYKKMVRAFGPSCLNKKGEIDRKKMGKIVFENPEKRKILNTIVHPEIFKKERVIERQIKRKNRNAVIVYDSPLLIETGSFVKMDAVVLVHVKREIQISRLIKRNHLTLDESVKRVRAQFSHSQKRKYADYLIKGDEGRESTRKRVHKIFREILEEFRPNR
ncbi:MAG: dephospho-CoA kinase [Nitrospirae bacterium]|nr:dephospho-CoA kinase [Nitrospirota bacterium]